MKIILLLKLQKTVKETFTLLCELYEDTSYRKHTHKMISADNMQMQ
jgi:hypothetical protein